jgi:hypothetical protein
MTATRFFLLFLLATTTTLFRTTNTVVVTAMEGVSTALDITFNATSCTSCIENGEGMCQYCETQKDTSGQYRCDCEFTSNTADRNCYDAVRECGTSSSGATATTTTMGRVTALLVATTAAMVATTTSSSWYVF